jgi:hypothetical protein
MRRVPTSPLQPLYWMPWRIIFQCSTIALRCPSDRSRVDAVTLIVGGDDPSLSKKSLRELDKPLIPSLLRLLQDRFDIGAETRFTPIISCRGLRTSCITVSGSFE